MSVEAADENKLESDTHMTAPSVRLANESTIEATGITKPVLVQYGRVLALAHEIHGPQELGSPSGPCDTGRPVTVPRLLVL